MWICVWRMIWVAYRMYTYHDVSRCRMYMMWWWYTALRLTVPSHSRLPPDRRNCHLATKVCTPHIGNTDWTYAFKATGWLSQVVKYHHGYYQTLCMIVKYHFTKRESQLDLPISLSCRIYVMRKVCTSQFAHYQYQLDLCIVNHRQTWHIDNFFNIQQYTIYIYVPSHLLSISTHSRLYILQNI